MKRLFIEPLLMPEQAVVWTTPEEQALAQRFPSSRRRREYLSWRALVRRELGMEVRIGYNAVGAPLVDCEGVHLGVSHNRENVAVCISDWPCAVDVESSQRDFSRVVPRYMTAFERALSHDRLWPAVAWCAKETLYKFAGREGLDLLRDLRIEACDLPAGRLWGRIENGEPVGLSVLSIGDQVVVYIL